MDDSGHSESTNRPTSKKSPLALDFQALPTENSRVRVRYTFAIRSEWR